MGESKRPAGRAGGERPAGADAPTSHPGGESKCPPGRPGGERPAGGGAPTSCLAEECRLPADHPDGERPAGVDDPRGARPRRLAGDGAAIRLRPDPSSKLEVALASAELLGDEDAHPGPRLQLQRASGARPRADERIHPGGERAPGPLRRRAAHQARRPVTVGTRRRSGPCHARPGSAGGRVLAAAVAGRDAGPGVGARVCPDSARVPRGAAPGAWRGGRQGPCQVVGRVSGRGCGGAATGPALRHPGAAAPPPERQRPGLEMVELHRPAAGASAGAVGLPDIGGLRPVGLEEVERHRAAPHPYVFAGPPGASAGAVGLRGPLPGAGAAWADHPLPGRRGAERRRRRGGEAAGVAIAVTATARAPVTSNNRIAIATVKTAST